MASIQLQSLAHRYPSAPDYALRSMQQTWSDGGAYALLGPSGCGKTTLLNIISGLLRPSEGRVLFDDIDVTDLTTEQRNIAQVFQFPVVYDTMTVAENLAFPLHNRGIAKNEIEKRVADVLQMLDLQDRANDRARSLTADDKQKISLGRGLVRTDVQAILFDEPLTVIDPHLKWQLRTELKKIHQRFQHTMIYVTHDQTEALTFADQVIVMYEGAVVQIGTPQQLFETPEHTFVGRFIGSPGMNVLSCEVDASDAIFAGKRFPLSKTVDASASRFELGIRPEHIKLSAGDGMPLTVTALEDVGRHVIVRGEIEGTELSALVKDGDTIPQNPHVSFDSAHVNLYADDYRVVSGKGG
ncbi:MAG: ABC transporter ATP-binding protein [Gammaproteobacteria bacterium]|nr:ABC transporter ATP-binding protein [Gammaproteobacteria bacterium]